MNPENPRHIKRLREAMTASARKLSPFQRDFVSLWRHYAGDHYGDEGIDRLLPINLVRMAIDVWSRSLAAKAPKVLVETRKPGLRPLAFEMQLAIDHTIAEIKYGRTLRMVVKSALVQMGIIKVGVTDSALHEAMSIFHDQEQVYADHVLFGDWIHDMNARCIEEWQFCGNRYRLPLEDVKQNPLFSNTDNLQGRVDDPYNDYVGGDSTRVEEISQGDSSLGEEEYTEHVELWDIWLPRENLVVTLPANGEGEPLLITEWTGPERGPFHVLTFGDIPGNVVPTGAVSTVFDIHDLQNRLFVKLGDQAERQKTVGVASQAAVADGTADQVLDIEDGGVFSSSHPDAVRELRFGGIDQQTLSFVGWLRGMGSYIGGNLDVLGGLQQGADTLGQEKLLTESSSQMIEDLRTTTDVFNTEVLTDVAWWIYSNPNLRLNLTKSSPSGMFEESFDWGPDRREADFFEYSLKVAPFSSAPQSPRDKLQFISAFVRQEVLPMHQAGILAANQLNFDAKEYFRTMANLSDTHEINNFLKVNGAALPDEPEGMPEQRMPANTTREYVRRNVPSSSQGGVAGLDRQAMQNSAGASMPTGTGPSMMPQGA